MKQSVTHETKVTSGNWAPVVSLSQIYATENPYQKGQAAIGTTLPAKLTTKHIAAVTAAIATALSLPFTSSISATISATIPAAVPSRRDRRRPTVADGRGRGEKRRRP